MEIEKTRAVDIETAGLYNAYSEGEMCCKKFSYEEFSHRFFEPAEGCEKAFFTAYDGKSPVGFACGCRVAGRNASYVTLVLVKKEFRGAGLGSILLRTLEADITDENTQKLEASFYNPMSLPWLIPGTPGHDHPGYPGVDMQSGGYLFMKNNGYRNYAEQNSYYRALEGYALPADIVEKEEKARECGLRVTYYDKGRHTGIEELMTALKSEGWKATVLNNLSKKQPLPLLVAEDSTDGGGKARAVGFTGPVTVQESGRGYLCGIGVHPDYRGHGLGKILFCRLCEANKAAGASFMSLFTGEENPARNIYEAAGFRIVRSWACMRKH